MSFDAMWAALERVGRHPRTGGYRRFAWTRDDTTLREWFAGEASARGPRPGRRTAPATSGRGGATRTPPWRPAGRGWSSARTWTRCPTAAPSTARSAWCRPSRRSTCCAATGFAPDAAARRRQLRRRGGRPVRHRLRRLPPHHRRAGRRPGPGAARRRRGDDGRGDGRGRARPGRPRRRRRDAAPDRRVRRAARRAGPRPGRPRPRRSASASAIWPHGRWRLDLPGEANHAGTTRLEDRHDPMLALAAAVLAARRGRAGARVRRHRRQGRGGPGRRQRHPVAGHRLAGRPRPRRRTTCARSSPSVGAQAGGRDAARGVVDPDDGVRRRAAPADLSRHARPRRRCWPPAPGTTPASSPRAGLPTAMLFVRNPTGVSHSPAEHAEHRGLPPRASRRSPRWSASWPDERPSSGPALARDARAGCPSGLARRRPARGARRPVHRRRPADSPAPATPSGSPGVVLPGPGQRPQPRLPPRAARPHPRRRRHLLDLARADVRRRRAARPGLATSRWPGPSTPRWRWPASPAWASSTTCTTRPGGTPYADPNAMGEALSQAAAEAGIRLTLLDTCYLAGGLEPRRARAAGRTAAALRRRHGRALGGARWRRCARTDAGCGSARRSTRCARCRGRAWRRGRRGRRGPAAARAPVRAAGRERGVPGVLRRDARPRCSTTQGVLGAADHGGARHPPDRPTTSRCSARTGTGAASAPPPSATSPTASARPAPCATPAARCPSAPTSTPSSTCSRRPARLEMHERLASPAARPVLVPTSCSRAATARHAESSAGPTPAASRRARAPTSSRSAWTSPRTAGCRPGQIVLPPRRPTSTPSWSTAGVVVTRRPAPAGRRRRAAAATPSTRCGRTHEHDPGHRHRRAGHQRRRARRHADPGDGLGLLPRRRGRRRRRRRCVWIGPASRARRTPTTARPRRAAPSSRASSTPTPTWCSPVTARRSSPRG